MNNFDNVINIIGAGLAGCEAAYQAAKRGLKVNLYEMKPKKFSPAHSNENFCELVCSNSLKNSDPLTSSGMLKEELKFFDSLVLACAMETSVPAGGALAVDRELFSKKVTQEIRSFKGINIISEEVEKIGGGSVTIIATGPLTEGKLAEELKILSGEENLYFFDAAAPIVDALTIDYNKAFFMNRYNKEGGEYLNCPLNKSEYEIFYNELINAETVQLKSFENQKVFEGCMPIEIMAKRGHDTIRFGPLKPQGLFDEKNNLKPYAVVQLRKENLEGSYYNLVGFQTNLTFKEQKRVFSLIPALKNAEFIKYGVMHRNTFINSPKVLNNFFQLRSNENIFIAGQLSGVEGYLESCASGLMAGINAANLILNKPMIDLTSSTMIGALSQYISSFKENFQPVNSNYAILKPLDTEYKNKDIKKQEYLKRSTEELKKLEKLL